MSVKELKKPLATYEVTQRVEMTITHRVRATSTSEASAVAAKRTSSYCQRISDRYRFVRM